MRKRWIRNAVPVALLLLAGPAIVLGQTPDGETPAEESVCDVLANATPGLYGLCVAYCEAHDADSINAECNPSPQKLLDNYNRKMQPGDPPMPCIQPVCPCWSVEQIGDFDKYGCTDVLDTEGGVIKKLSTTISGTAAICDPACHKFPQSARVGGSGGTKGKFQCVFERDRKVTSLEITEEEALACRDTLLLFDPVCFAL